MSEEKYEGSCTFSIKPPPKTVGFWILAKNGSWETRFGIPYKPNWFHRMMVKACFGVGWKDA